MYGSNKSVETVGPVYLYSVLLSWPTVVYVCSCIWFMNVRGRNKTHFCTHNLSLTHAHSHTHTLKHTDTVYGDSP